MATEFAHGGGPIDSVVIDDQGGEVLAKDTLRSFAEIQMDEDSTADRVYLAIGGATDPEYGKGIYLRKGGHYTIAAGNLTAAAVKAIAPPGQTAILGIQIGR